MKNRIAAGLLLAALVSVTYSNGRSLRYSYDAADNLLSVQAATTAPPASRSVSISAGGVEQVITTATAAQTSGGYATVGVASGEAPYGVAIFSLEQNGAVVFEAGVPASPPTTRARVFIEYRTGGGITIDTGVAMVNPGGAPARVRCTLRDTAGAVVGSGVGTLAPGRHAARLIGELNTVVPDFRLPADFATSTRFGSLDLESDQPLSVTALRLTINQRNELLFTSTPVADLATPPGAGPVHFPHLAEGGGFTSAFVLLNTSTAGQTGSLQFLGDDGAPLRVTLTDGRSGTSFDYSIPAGGVAVVETNGAGAQILGGWARAVPAAGQSSPVGAGSFRFVQNGIVVTESGISSARPTTLARIFVDTSGSRDTGLAIANPGAAAVTATLRAFALDGRTPAGSGPATVEVPAGAHLAREAGRFVSGLPAGFRGVLEIESAQPLVALTVRSLTNSRGELLFATLPVADLRQPAPTPVIFPHIADGGGFRTELILLGAGSAASATVSFFDDDGASLPVVQRYDERD
jgi:YD repeat-containing protein